MQANCASISKPIAIRALALNCGSCCLLGVAVEQSVGSDPVGLCLPVCRIAMHAHMVPVTMLQAHTLSLHPSYTAALHIEQVCQKLRMPQNASSEPPPWPVAAAAVQLLRVPVLIG